MGHPDQLPNTSQVASEIKGNQRKAQLVNRSTRGIQAVITELLDEAVTPYRPLIAIASDLELVLELGPLISDCWLEDTGLELHDLQ